MSTFSVRSVDSPGDGWVAVVEDGASEGEIVALFCGELRGMAKEIATRLTIRSLADEAGEEG